MDFAAGQQAGINNVEFLVVTSTDNNTIIVNAAAGNQNLTYKANGGASKFNMSHKAIQGDDTLVTIGGKHRQ